MSTKQHQLKDRRIARVRAKIQGTKERPRLAVYRSLSHIYAQIIDDAARKTLASAKDGELSVAERKGKNKTAMAEMVGALVAERAKEKGVTKVVFDRRDKKYHGRVKALAEAARKAGLIF